MHLDGLPGADAPVRKRPKSSPASTVVSHLVNQMRRPTRLRRRAVLAAIAIAGIISLIIGRRHADELQQTVSTLGAYIPHSITDVISHHEETEHNRWDDTTGLTNGTEASKKPKFHLLIPTPDARSTPNLCKTLLSAVVLNYPPPTLLHYQEMGVNIRPGADVVRNIFSFLLGKEAHDDDLILIVEEDSWLQLPAEVIINRFFHGLQNSNEILLKKYGQNKAENDTTNLSSEAPKYTQRILFSAQKECSNPPGDPACYSIPQSTLPKDIYGPQTDSHPESKYNRPRFMASTMVMGRVTDLRPIYKLASELLEFEEIGKYGSQHIFSFIFGQQEYARSLTLPGKSRWRTWFASKLHFNVDPNSHPNMTLVRGKNYEFGIGLDYASSIFQLMNNSVEDVRSVNFSDLSTIASFSKTPINLPLDLSLSPPYPDHNATPISALDNLPSEKLTWADLELVTNVIIPGYSVPATLSFHGNATTAAMTPIWSKMWYHPSLRALLRHHNRSPSLPIPADQLWDLRGGRGGIWNEAGEWNEWSELCAAYSDEVFGDDEGVFGQEVVEDGGDARGRPVYNKWGLLMSGKEGVDAETNTVLEEVMEEEVKKGIKGEENEVVNEELENVGDEIEKGQKLEQEQVRASDETGESEAGKEAERLFEEALKKEEEIGEKALGKVKQQKEDLADYGNPESGNENKTPIKASTPIEDPRAPPLVPGQSSHPTEVELLQPSNANTSALLKTPGSPSSNEPPIPGKPLLAEGKGGKIELNDQQSQPAQHTNPTHHDIEDTEQEPQAPQGKSSASDQQPQDTGPKHHDTEETEEEAHTPQRKYSASGQPDTDSKSLVDSEKEGMEKGGDSSQAKYMASDKPPQSLDANLNVHREDEKGEIWKEPQGKYSAPKTLALDPLHGKEENGEMGKGEVEVDKNAHTSSKYSASKVPGVNEEYVDNDTEWSF